MSAWGQKRLLPHRNIDGRFTSINRHTKAVLSAPSNRLIVGCDAMSAYGTAALAPSKGWRIAPTCTCVHTPPRVVRTLRSLSFAAMALWLVGPARMISSMIGRTGL